LADLLRRVARAAQSPQARLFYSLRQVAAQYGLPLSKVVRAYRGLEAEGLLNLVRSSGTILQGSAPIRHLKVRHVVGMPAALSCFITLQDYRSFFIKTRREFRRRGCITAISFYELQDDDVAERLQEARADLILWYLPDSVTRLTLPRLQDRGIRLVGISDGGLPSIACRYEIRREAAIRMILREWMAAGITRVSIPRADACASADEERLAGLLAETSFDWHFLESRVDSAAHILGLLAPEKKQGILFLARAASMFLMRAPVEFHNLFRTTRVALLDGPVSMPFAPFAGIMADLVVVDWPGVARRLAADILSREAFLRVPPTIFEAKVELSVPLDRFAQKI
jgi:hypothetical protein